MRFFRWIAVRPEAIQKSQIRDEVVDNLDYYSQRDAAATRVKMPRILDLFGTYIGTW